MFTGFVFYRHLPEHRFVNGIPGLVDAEYLPELRRWLEGAVRDLEPDR